MKKILKARGILFTLTCFFCTANPFFYSYSQIKYPVKSSDTRIPCSAGYTLKWQDDFSGNKLNTQSWSYFRLGDTVFNSIYKKQNAKLHNGKLLLITDSIAPGLYTSCNISTEFNKQFHFKYGYFEIRAKQPRNYGNGSAFWIITGSATIPQKQINPAKYGAEIDIFEYSPTTPDKIFYSLHWNGYGADGLTRSFTDTNPWGFEKPDEYHTYGLLWTPSEYIVYVDGKERTRSSEAVSQIPEFLILGCGTGGFAGPPQYAKGPWPDTFAIDYIKVYQQQGLVLNGDCNFKGWASRPLQPGSYNRKQLEALGFFDNATSSIYLPDGWVATLYDGSSFNGDSLIIKEPVICFDKTANDRLSSLKITAAPKVARH